MVYLYFQVGDALAFMHVQVAWGRELQSPVSVALGGWKQGGWNRYFVLCAALGLGIGGWLFWRKRYGYSLFLIGTILVPLATGVASLPRYVFWQFPFLFGLVDLLSLNQTLKSVFLAFSTAMAGFMILSWFAGKTFVI
jgi:hypothetical protein